MNATQLVLVPKVILIAGSRNFTCYMQLSKVMDHVLEKTGNPTLVISGGAPGVDTLAEQWAKEHHFAFKPFPADWKKHGKRAGPLRNSEMMQIADVVVALPAPDSIGTLDTIRKAERTKKELFVFNIVASDERSYTRGH